MIYRFYLFICFNRINLVSPKDYNYLTFQDPSFSLRVLTDSVLFSEIFVPENKGIVKNLCNIN